VISFTPRHISPEKDNPDTHWVGRWVGPKTGLHDVLGGWKEKTKKKRKILPYGE
jgi:hypothetical protein